MRLGATIHRYCGLRINDPESYIAECRKMGFRAATCPDHLLGNSTEIRKIREAFQQADIVIAEIGGWSNCLDLRDEVRREAIKTTSEALAVADEVDAVCCINLPGSFATDMMYGPHPDNFSDEAFDAVVQWVQHVLRNVRPKRTRLAIETTPWTPIDSAQSYQRLLQAVNDEALAVHLDPVNLITDAHRYYRTTEVLDECFDLFGPKIIACHAKDILQGDPKTVNLTEVPPGEGVLDYNTFLKRARQLSSDLPIVIEHLDTELQYANAAAHLQRIDNLSTSANNE